MKHHNPFGLTLNRRGFLGATGLGAGAVMLGSGLVPRLAHAQTRPDHRFVFVYFSGGWDTLLCLDPRDPGVFTEESARDTKIQLGWDRLDPGFAPELISFGDSPITFGPAIGDFARHYQKACVVRGLSMDTLTHEVGRRYMITGKMPAGLQATGSAIPTRIVAQNGEVDGFEIPNLASQVETYNKGLPTFATGMSVNGPSDLVFALQKSGDAPKASIEGHLASYRAKAVSCDPVRLDRRGFMGLIKESQGRATDLVENALHTYFDFGNQQSAEMGVLRERYGIGGVRPGGLGAGVTSGEQAALAAQALKNDISQCVSITLATGLDTHDDNWATDHPETLQQGFNALAALIDDLEEASLMEKTTIVVFSEFGRTSLLNTRDGRDHSLASSALLIGAGVPANTVVGATTDVGMSPMPINAETGEVLATGGTTVTPTKLLASVMEANGYDPYELREPGLPCLMA